MESQATPTREQISAAIDAEEQALNALLARLTDDDWTRTRDDGWTVHEVLGHTADILSGMPRMLGAPPMEGTFDPDPMNEQNRQRNDQLDHDQIKANIQTGLATLRHKLADTTDLEAPGPFGPQPNAGQWLMMVPAHAAEHRQQVERAVPAH